MYDLSQRAGNRPLSRCRSLDGERPIACTEAHLPDTASDAAGRGRPDRLDLRRRHSHGDGTCFEVRGRPTRNFSDRHLHGGFRRRAACGNAAGRTRRNPSHHCLSDAVQDVRRRDPVRRFTRQQRREGMARAGGQCETETRFRRRCSRAAEHGDHFYPWSKGGSTSVQNFVAACSRRNRAKGARIPSPAQQERLERRRLASVASRWFWSSTRRVYR